MPRSIEVVYENGVLKPLSALKLREHEKLRIILDEGKGTVKATSGMFSGLDDSTINEVALSPEFIPEEV